MPIVVTFVSQKGGVGKSTLARSVAVMLARAKVNVLLADCDDQQSTAVKWNRVRAENQRAPAIDVVSASSAAKAIAHAERVEVAVVDMPSRVNRATLDAARQSHVIVQPTGPTLDDLYPSVLLFHGLVAAGIPKERLLFVLCARSRRAKRRQRASTCTTPRMTCYGRRSRRSSDTAKHSTTAGRRSRPMTTC